MQNIIIRKANINDAEKIADIKIEGWKTAYKGIIDDSFLNNMSLEKETEKRRINIENGVNIFVAEIDGEVAGFCMYRDYNENLDKYPEADCEITSLYVRNKLRRKGIGKKLFQHMLEKFKADGKKKMILGCLEENYPSRAFYEKMSGEVLSYDEIEFENKKYGLALYEYDITNI